MLMWRRLCHTEQFALGVVVLEIFWRLILCVDSVLVPVILTLKHSINMTSVFPLITRTFMIKYHLQSTWMCTFFQDRGQTKVEFLSTRTCAWCWPKLSTWCTWYVEHNIQIMKNRRIDRAYLKYHFIFHTFLGSWNLSWRAWIICTGTFPPAVNSVKKQFHEFTIWEPSETQSFFP